MAGYVMNALSNAEKITKFCRAKTAGRQIAGGELKIGLHRTGSIYETTTFFHTPFGGTKLWETFGKGASIPRLGDVTKYMGPADGAFACNNRHNLSARGARIFPRSTGAKG